MSQNMDELLKLPGFSDDDDDDTAALPVARKPGGRSPQRRRGLIIAIAVLLLLILLIGVVLGLVRGRQRTQLQDTQVLRGNFALTVSATGPVQSGSYNVNFSGTGKIAEIDVTVGESVTKGQVLARMDKTSLQDAVNSAQAAVLAAVTGVNNAQNTFGKTAAQSRAAVAAAQTTLNNAQASLSNTQSQSQASIAAAQTALTDAQNSLLNIQAESAASISSAQTALANAQSNLAAVQAQTQQQLAVAYDQEQAAIKACNGDATCIQTAKDQYNQAVATANASVTNAQNQVNAAQKQLSSAQAQAAANNAQAQAQVNTAQSQLNTAQAQANSGNASAQAQVNSAQAQLNTALANSASSNATAQSQISTAQAQLHTAQVQLETAQHNLANATLTAPHDGIVTIINGSVGGTPGASTGSTGASGSNGAFIQIVDVSALQVLADVNESDTGYLKIGEPALFTVSAYSNRTFRGTVIAISPNGQTVSNVVTYPVYIDVDMNNLQGATLLPGMTANVTINVVQRPNVLLIPVSAVNFARAATTTASTSKPLITQDQANVALDQARQMLRTLQFQQPAISNDNPIPAFVLERTSNGQFVVKPVVLGLTDQTVYEVLAGLSPGETIISSAQTTTGGGLRPLAPGGGG